MCTKDEDNHSVKVIAECSSAVICNSNFLLHQNFVILKILLFVHDSYF